MTHILIRRTAKDMAGAFYEQNMRSEMFRRAFPKASDFIHGRAHRRDGSVELQDPNWWQFVDLAKEQLAKMLTDESVSQHLKDRIEDALIENATRGTQDANAIRVHQTNLDRREDKPPEQTMVRL